MNDEETRRTYGSKTDAYAEFKRMLDKNRPPALGGDLIRHRGECMDSLQIHAG